MRKLLQTALKYYQNLLEQQQQDPTLKADLAATWFRLGEIQGEIGSRQESLTAYQHSLAIRQELVKADPGNRDYRRAGHDLLPHRPSGALPGPAG